MCKLSFSFCPHLQEKAGISLINLSLCYRQNLYNLSIYLQVSLSYNLFDYE